MSKQTTKEKTRLIDGVEYAIVDTVEALPEDMQATLANLKDAQAGFETVDNRRADLVAEYLWLSQKHQIRLIQTKLAEFTGVSQAYVSQIGSTLKRAAASHGGDTQKAIAELAKKGVNSFKKAHPNPKAKTNDGGNTDPGRLELDSPAKLITAMVALKVAIRHLRSEWSTDDREKVVALLGDMLDDAVPAEKPSKSATG